MVDPDDRSCFDDFHPFHPMPLSSRLRWTDKVPHEFVDIWDRWGLGMFCNGYLRVVNPDDWLPLLTRLYMLPWKQSSIPVLATAYGDLIVWEQPTNVLATLQFRNNICRLSTLRYYFPDINEPYFQSHVLGMRGYKSAVKRLGIPKYGDCYAYSPLTQQDGPEQVSHLHITNMHAYLKELISIGYQLNENNIRFPGV